MVDPKEFQAKTFKRWEGCPWSAAAFVQPSPATAWGGWWSARTTKPLQPQPKSKGPRSSGGRRRSPATPPVLNRRCCMPWMCWKGRDLSKPSWCSCNAHPPSRQGPRSLPCWPHSKERAAPAASLSRLGLASFGGPMGEASTTPLRCPANVGRTLNQLFWKPARSTPWPSRPSGAVAAASAHQQAQWCCRR